MYAFSLPWIFEFQALPWFRHILLDVGSLGRWRNSQSPTQLSHSVEPSHRSEEMHMLHLNLKKMNIDIYLYKYIYMLTICHIWIICYSCLQMWCKLWPLWPKWFGRNGLVNRQLKQLSFLHSNRHAGSKLQGRSPKGTECFSGLTFTACNAHQIDLDRFDDLILSSYWCQYVRKTSTFTGQRKELKWVKDDRM